MKKISSVLSILIILGVISWSFSDLKPSLQKEKSLTKEGFSTINALEHVKNISLKQHCVGSKEHKNVQKYIAEELNKMGLETEIQVQTAVNKKWFAATTVQNIIAKIKGSENGKALMLSITLNKVQTNKTGAIYGRTMCQKTPSESAPSMRAASTYSVGKV